MTTERLTLRRFSLDDSKDVFEKWACADDSRFWEPPHTNVKETEQMLKEYAASYDKPAFYMWGVVFEGELVGLVCGNEINEDIESVCIGYCFAKSCWNKGIATEASRALIRYFFDCGFNRVFSYHNPLNPASGRVMQKCGMRFEGRIRGGSRYSGEICDCLQYAILKTDVAAN